MREPLPQPDHQPYDRPQQPWVCGRAAEGDPCAFGPNARGVCPAVAECQPIEVDGEWQCDRPATRGGPCDDGPTSEGACCRLHRCRPVRNLRSTRGALVRMAFVFAVGTMLMLLGSNWRNHLLAPGPLCSQHAQVLRGEGWNNRCTTCHSAADQSAATWLTAVIGQSVGPTQSSKCMACHDKTISPELALYPHNLPADELGATAGSSSSGRLTPLHTAGQASSGARSDLQNLACSVCHQEHQGAGHAIAAMDNHRCQSCHTRQFESFATDHPDLGVWPYERRTPIAFSHTTHAGKHFAEKNVEFTCARCHVEDATRNMQLTLSYEAACAECHEEDITNSIAGGVRLFTLPSVDLDAFAEANINLGPWPDRATGDFDGALPPVMKLLLSTDPKARRAMERFGADFEFYDIDPDNPEDLQAAADLASTIKNLLTSPEASLLHQTGNLPKDKLLAGLSPHLLQSANKKWLGTDSASQTNPDDELTQSPGAWFLQNTDFSIRYQPTGHADPVLKAWIEAALAVHEPKLRDVLVAELAGPNSSGRCASCHSIDQQPSGALAIHWRPHDRRLEPRGFTRFSHAPHLLQVELRDCTACHEIATDAYTTTNYTSRNPAAFVRDFKPMSQMACASCHTKAIAGDSCTQCHNYHVSGQ